MCRQQDHNDYARNLLMQTQVILIFFLFSVFCLGFFVFLKFCFYFFLKVHILIKHLERT